MSGLPAEASAKAGANTDGGSPKITLLAAGDVLLARGIGKAIAAHGAAFPFAPTRDLVRQTDLAVFNLECALSRRGVAQYRRFQFRADPDLAKTLADTGLDVAVLANNHTLDYGREALTDTIAAVEKAGMAAVGAGKNRSGAARLKVVERKGLRVGFMAYTDMPNVGVVRRDDLPTVCGLADGRLAAEVRAAAKRCDTLVVYVHWGQEYMTRPTERQQALGRLMIDSGADLVLGCHPHVVQPVETYKGKPIAYSLGGYVFDSVRFDSDKGALFEFDLGRDSARLLRRIPILMKGGRTILTPVIEPAEGSAPRTTTWRVPSLPG